MRLFTSESFYDVKTGQWEDRYWIDGIEKDGDLYYFELEREKDLETEKLLKECEIEDDECDCCGCYECTIDRYTELLSEITGGCPHCIRNVLDCFCDDIIEHIVIEDMDESECDNTGILN